MNVSALEMFRHACGRPSLLEFDVVGPDGTTFVRRQLDRPFARIGRDSRNEIRLDSSSVSGRHAYMQVVAGRPFVVDLGSRSGTRWRGERQSAGWLGPEDTLNIGDFSIRLAPRSAESSSETSASLQECNPLEARSANRAGLPTFSLELAGRNGNVQRLQVDRVLTLVGRVSACKLRLLDQSVSRFHCALVQTPHGLWAIDLHGKDGTWVDGRRVRWARLDNGARLRAGSFPMRVWHERDCLAPTAGPFFQALSIGEPWTTEPSNGTGEIAASPGDVQRLGAGSSLLPGRPERFAPPQEIGSLVPLPAPNLAGPLVDGAIPSLLLQQFGALHQQMLAQFQRCMLVMAQMLTTLRQEEMELLREVLERVGALEHQVRGLATAGKKRAARLARKDQETAQAAESRSEQPLVPALGERVRGEGVAEGPGEAGPTFAATPPAPVGNGVAANPPLQAGETASNSEPSAPTSPAGTDGDANLHAWLSGRIAILDQERQGAWRKILAMLLGK
jgi:pSer/pThr/pTyr-binding forkhead associated (FHA) protein